MVSGVGARRVCDRCGRLRPVGELRVVRRVRGVAVAWRCSKDGSSKAVCRKVKG